MMRGFEDPKGQWMWGMGPARLYADGNIAFGMPARRSGKSAVVDDRVEKLLQEGRTVMTRVGDKFTTLRMDDPCDNWAHVHHRPAEPHPAVEHLGVWYRGWEVAFSYDAHFWGGDGWIAYKGGCDLDAPEVRSATYSGCLDAIDEQEDD